MTKVEVDNDDVEYRYTAFGEVTIYDENGAIVSETQIENTILWNTRRRDEVSGYLGAAKPGFISGWTLTARIGIGEMCCCGGTLDGEANVGAGNPNDQGKLAGLPYMNINYKATIVEFNKLQSWSAKVKDTPTGRNGHQGGFPLEEIKP